MKLLRQPETLYSRRGWRWWARDSMNHYVTDLVVFFYLAFSEKFIKSFYHVFCSGTASNDSVGENVKDAHIKHLQRQVTVLQATLYKSEGWAHRYC